MTQINPFEHTSGRWLRLDSEQREARRVNFNIDQLCKRVLSLCPAAASIQSCQKLERGFSKAFVITTDDGNRLVAKFPTSVAGPPRLVTHRIDSPTTTSEQHAYPEQQGSDDVSATFTNETFLSPKKTQWS